MDDLISRQAAIESFKWDDNGTAWTMEDIIYRLEQFPSAQPELSTDVENALALLDGIRASGRMEYYSDYCALHDAISLISAEPETKEIGYTDCANAMLKMWMDKSCYRWRVQQNYGQIKCEVER